MREVLILHYFYDVEHFVPLMEHLKSYLYSVRSFGMLLEQQQPHFFQRLMDAVRESDIVLFWFNNLNAAQMKCLRVCFPEKLFVRYNWYDVEEDAGWYDLYVTASAKQCGAKVREGCEVVYCPAGVDTKHFRPLRREEEFDVAIFAHRIFAERERVIERVRHMGLRVALYGCAAAGEMYPELYQGEVSYDAMPEAMAKARLQLVVNAHSDDCFTDTFFKALSCGAAVVTNINKAPFYGKCIVLRDDNTLEEQLRDALAGDHAVMRARARLLAKQFDWSEFVRRLHVRIAKRLFDPVFYASTYDLSLPHASLFDYWLHYGLPNREVPFSFRITAPYTTTTNALCGRSDHFLAWYAALEQAPTIASSDEIPSHIEQQLQDVFRGGDLSALPPDAHLSDYVVQFMA